MSQDLNRVTGGLTPGISQGNYAPLVTGGIPLLLDPTPQLNPSEDPKNYNLNRLNLTPKQLADYQSIVTLKDLSGSKIVPTPDGFVQLGDGVNLAFDPDTLQGRLTGRISTSELHKTDDVFGDIGGVYTGTDMKILIEAAETTPDGRRYAKQLLEATTITVSVHREVAPVRASGYINPKGFALGKRTIAGTLIVNQFTADVLLNFLQSVMVADGSKDTVFTKVDQLPPFNITLLFTNEFGYASERKLLGVKFVTDGVVYSIQDMMTEQTVSFMAYDFTPLVPLTLNSLYQPTNPLDPRTRREKTPADLMRT